MKAYKKGFTISVILLSVLILCSSVFSVFLWNVSAKIKREYTQTNATIIKIEDESTYIAFEVGEDIIEVCIDEYSSSWKEGDIIKIYYNPQNVSKIYTDESLYVGLIFSAIYAGVLLIILIVLIIKYIRKKKITNWLLENGQKIYAKILDYYINYRRNFVSSRSKTIICQYKDKVFKDNYFYSSIADFTNKEIAVYFNPDKEKQFYIDETDVRDVNE